jgi:hypothetical protein
LSSCDRVRQTNCTLSLRLVCTMRAIVQSFIRRSPVTTLRKHSISSCMQPVASER